MTKQHAQSFSNSRDKPKVELVLDSGAYSAWKLGSPIDLDEYCRYASENADMFSHVVNLDVINPDDPDASARASFENLKIMRARGINAVPVFHARESMDWLHRMLDLGCDYIGLSASSLVQRNQVDEWYGLAWSELTNSAGQPLVKAHAFGESRYQTLARFPWYSADSASWIIQAEVGGKAVFHTEQGKPSFVSVRNDKLHTKAAPDIDHLDAEEERAVNALLRETGMTLEFFADKGPVGAMARLWAMARIYIDIERRVTAKCPIHHMSTGFFSAGCAPVLSGSSPLSIPALRLHLVLNTNPRTFLPLVRTAHPSLLASFFYTRKMTSFNLRNFVYNPEEEVSTSRATGHYWKMFLDYESERGIKWQQPANVSSKPPRRRALLS